MRCIGGRCVRRWLRVASVAQVFSAAVVGDRAVDGVAGNIIETGTSSYHLANARAQRAIT